MPASIGYAHLLVRFRQAGLLARTGVVTYERTMVSRAPGKGEPARREAANRAGDHAVEGDERRVARGQQDDTAAIHQRLVGLPNAGDLRPDHWRLAVSGVGGQPVVPQRPGAARQRQERLVEQVGEVNRDLRPRETLLEPARERA